MIKNYRMLFPVVGGFKKDGSNIHVVGSSGFEEGFWLWQFCDIIFTIHILNAVYSPFN